MKFSRAVSAPARDALAVGCTGAVVVASLVHAPPAVAATGPLGLVGVDKWIHAGSHAGIAVLFAFAALARTVPILVAIAVGSVLIGGGVELLQSTIPWRTTEFADVLANGAGTVVALAVWWSAWRTVPTDVGPRTASSPEANDGD